MSGSGHLEVVLRNLPSERERLAWVLRDFANAHGISPRAIHAVDMALEEHLTNVFRHAYGGADDGEARVRLVRTGRSMEVEVEDTGPAFDPTAVGGVDVTVPLEEREVGGLGIHLMRRFLDGLEYRRETGRNILRMIKRLES